MRQQQAKVRTPTTSFIVRVWADEGEGPQARGEIEHIGTGERRLFLNYAALLSLIENWRRELAQG